MLAADGLPALIRPLPGWRRAVAANRVETVTGEAFTAAHRAHVTTTVDHARRALRESPPTVSVAGVRRVTSPGSVVSLLQVLERAQHLEADRGLPRRVVGLGAGGAVTVVLARPSLVRCAVDRRWAMAASPTLVAAGLAQALAAARQALDAAPPEAPGDVSAALVVGVLEWMTALRAVPVAAERVAAAGSRAETGPGDGADGA